MHPLNGTVRPSLMADRPVNVENPLELMVERGLLGPLCSVRLSADLADNSRSSAGDFARGLRDLQTTYRTGKGLR
jgi:hypothetical protein